jgi:hypothetical protein
MAKQKQPPWQFKLTMALSVFMLLLIFGYFAQSFQEIRKVKPVVVAIEKIKNKNQSDNQNPELVQTIENNGPGNSELNAQ